MDPYVAILAALVGVLGGIIGAWFGAFVAQRQMLTEFSKPIHEKRLEGYRQIFALVSGFIKKIHPDSAGESKISREDFETFRNQYFDLDSQWSLLFSENVWSPSAALIEKLREILGSCGTADPISLPEDIGKCLSDVEDGLKSEMAVASFTNPDAIVLKRFNATRNNP